MTRQSRREFLARREFLEYSMLSAASAALAAGGLSRSARAAEAVTSGSKSPGDKLGVAIVGTGDRGAKTHLPILLKRDDVEILWLVDPDEERGQKAVEKAKEKQGRAPEFTRDMLKAFDDPAVDIVTVATPHHWHSLAAIWAMQRGKDVYVEKPVSHNVSEGRRCVEVARKYNRICQTGTQCRTHPGMREAMQYLRDGQMGKRQAGPRAVLQTPQGDRPTRHVCPAGSSRLQHVAGPGPRSARLTRQAVPLRLALAMALRQRRPGQPGSPSNGHRPLGSRARSVARRGVQLRRPCRPGAGCRRHAQHAGGDARLRRQDADVRGPRTGDRRLPQDDGTSRRDLRKRRRPQDGGADLLVGRGLRSGHESHPVVRRRAKRGRGQPLRQLFRRGPLAQSRRPDGRHPGRAPVEARCATWATFLTSSASRRRRMPSERIFPP